MLLLKATLILVAGTAACFALRRASADVRHRVWSCTFAALLALPLLALALPSWQFPVPETLNQTPKTVSPDLLAAASTGLEPLQSAPIPAVQSSASDSPNPSPFADVTLLQILALTWLTGTVLALTTLVISLVRVRRLANSAALVTDDEWRITTEKLASRLGLRQVVRLLTSARVTTPMAGGLWRPTVYLPPSAAEWDAERRGVVLAHELAHLAARDPQRHMVARTAVALYWFHPLAWLAARQATTAREQACDEAVLMLGTRPSSVRTRPGRARRVDAEAASRASHSVDGSPFFAGGSSYGHSQRLTTPVRVRTRDDSDAGDCRRDHRPCCRRARRGTADRRRSLDRVIPLERRQPSCSRAGGYTHAASGSGPTADINARQ